jgi:hypothetical protein
MKKDEWIARCAHRYVEIAGVTLEEGYQAAYANFESEDGVFDESDDHCPEACADADDAVISRFLQNDTAADEIDALPAKVAALTAALGKAREALYRVQKVTDAAKWSGDGDVYHATVSEVALEALAAIDGVLNQQEISRTVTCAEGEEGESK